MFKLMLIVTLLSSPNLPNSTIVFNDEMYLSKCNKLSRDINWKHNKKLIHKYQDIMIEATCIPCENKDENKNK